MSWDSYIDNLLQQTNDAKGTSHCDKACIIGMDGSKWTTDAHVHAFKLTQPEAGKISAAFKSKDFSSFQAGGVFAEGTKYQFLRCEDDKIVYAKKKDHGAVTLQCSKTAVIVAHCPEGSQPGNLNKGVAAIADYLESLGM